MTIRRANCAGLEEGIVSEFYTNKEPLKEGRVLQLSLLALALVGLFVTFFVLVKGIGSENPSSDMIRVTTL